MHVRSSSISEIAFDNYKDFLVYVYNDLETQGKWNEIIEMVKNKPKGQPFDFKYATQEGTRVNILTNINNIK